MGEEDLREMQYLLSGDLVLFHSSREALEYHPKQGILKI